jgi:hypothetical protein
MCLTCLTPFSFDVPDPFLTPSVNDSPSTKPTAAAMSGDMPGKREGFSFFERLGVGIVEASIRHQAFGGNRLNRGSAGHGSPMS